EDPQSWHHSHRLPCMSNRPKAFGSELPTGSMYTYPSYPGGLTSSARPFDPPCSILHPPSFSRLCFPLSTLHCLVQRTGGLTSSARLYCPLYFPPVLSRSARLISCGPFSGWPSRPSC